MSELFPGLVQKMQSDETILIVQVAGHIMICRVTMASVLLCFMIDPF